MKKNRIPNLESRTSNTIRAATIISRILDPFILFTLVASIAVEKSGLTGFAFGRFLVILLAWMIFVPVIILIIAIKLRKVDSWDVGNLKERRPVLGLLLLHQFFNIWLVHVYGTPMLFSLMILFFMWLFGFFGISLFWKISGHAGVCALATGMILYWFGFSFWPVLFLVPLVSWARVERRNHTVAQVIAGALYSWVLLGFGSILHII
jgi:hypothetical protein